MSWHNEKLAVLRRAAGMEILPDIPDDPPVGFDFPVYPRTPELVPYRHRSGCASSCYWSAHALAYRDAAIAHVQAGRTLRPVDQIAFVRVITAADDGYRPSNRKQYRLAFEYRDFQAKKWDSYDRALRPFAWQIKRKWKAWNEGGRQGPEPPAWNYYEPGDEIPDVPGAPSPVLAYKKERMRNAGVSDDAVDKWIDVRKKAYDAVFGKG